MELSEPISAKALITEDRNSRLLPPGGCSVVGDVDAEVGIEEALLVFARDSRRFGFGRFIRFPWSGLGAWVAPGSFAASSSASSKLSVSGKLRVAMNTVHTQSVGFQQVKMCGAWVLVIFCGLNDWGMNQSNR